MTNEELQKNKMNYNDMSDESKNMVKEMVLHCLERGINIGMDGGIKNIKTGEKHDFINQLTSFSADPLTSDYDIWFNPCGYCKHDTANGTADSKCRCWKCGGIISRDYSDRALKKLNKPC